MLDYLKSKQKFNKRHLWDTRGILIGDKKIIFGLLTDIFEYYNIKINQTNILRIKQSSLNKEIKENIVIDEEENFEDEEINDEDFVDNLKKSLARNFSSKPKEHLT